MGIQGIHVVETGLCGVVSMDGSDPPAFMASRGPDCALGPWGSARGGKHGCGPSRVGGGASGLSWLGRAAPLRAALSNARSGFYGVHTLAAELAWSTQSTAIKSTGAVRRLITHMSWSSHGVRERRDGRAPGRPVWCALSSTRGETMGKIGKRASIAIAVTIAAAAVAAPNAAAATTVVGST